jgi:pimeloyl-ACP methyl ester carboxylesterase
LEPLGLSDVRNPGSAASVKEDVRCASTQIFKTGDISDLCQQGKIPGSQLVIIPGAGHLSNPDEPEAFNQHILTFLQDIKS